MNKRRPPRILCVSSATRLAIVLCFIATAWIPATAQTDIDEMEYFFDSDPGIGNGIGIPITPGPSQDINISISTSSLAVGFHTLVIRAKDISGNWSVQDSRIIYVLAETVGTDGIVGNVEYYIDTDPGPGNGTFIPIMTSFPTQVDLFPDIPMGSLAPGFHVLHVRAQNTLESWGIPDSRPFYIVHGTVDGQADVVQLEYFFDTEPGYGAGTALTVTAGSSISLPALISSTSLTEGFHTINIRAKDNDGQWGLAETRTFYVDRFSQVSLMEYYIDTDPGEGSATAIAITAGGTVDHTFTIPTGSIAGGGHTFGVRAATADGSWGSTSTQPFTIQESQTITFEALAAATYGDAPITLTGTSTSGLALTYTSSDPGVATISGSTVTIVGAGTTVITASQAGDASYAAATDMQQTLVVNKANQTITFDVLAPVMVGDPPFTLDGSSTSSLSVVYSSSNTSVATISGNTVTIVGEGTTDITASQPGDGNYNAAADVVQVLVVQAAPPVNNVPSISMTPGTAFFVSDPVVINNSITIADNDGSIAMAIISITSGFQSAEDQLLFTGQNGITGMYNSSTGILNISGAASVSDYQTALRSVQYNNTASSPDISDRTISIQVDDGIATSNIITTTITINKPPLIEAPSKDTQAGGNVAFIVDDIFSDPDDNLDFTTLSVVSAQGANVSIVAGVITVNYNNLPDFKGTDELTITICDLGGKCQTQVVTVDVGADVDVFNGISANSDGMNDYMRIRFLPAGSQVAIFNRWGDAVYESNDYDSNDPSKRFEGSNTDGNALATGTYYYKVTLPGGRELTGYLYLKRQ